MTLALRSPAGYLQVGGLLASVAGLAAALVTRQGYDVLFGVAAVVAIALDLGAIRSAPHAAAIVLAALKPLAVSLPVSVIFSRRPGVPDESLVDPATVWFILMIGAALAIAGAVGRRIGR